MFDSVSNDREVRTFLDESDLRMLERPDMCTHSLKTFKDYCASTGLFMIGSGSSLAEKTTNQYYNYAKSAMEYLINQSTKGSIGKDKISVHDFCEAAMMELLMPRIGESSFFVARGCDNQGSNKNKLYSLEKIHEFCKVKYLKELNVEAKAVLQLIRNIAKVTAQDMKTVLQLKKGMQGIRFPVFSVLIPRILSSCAAHLSNISKNEVGLTKLNVQEFYQIEGCVALIVLCLLGPNRPQIYASASFMFDQESVLQSLYYQRLNGKSKKEAESVVWLGFDDNNCPDKLTIVWDKVGSSTLPTILRIPELAKDVLRFYLSHVRPLVSETVKKGHFLFPRYQGDGMVGKKLYENINNILKTVDKELNCRTLRRLAETELDDRPLEIAHLIQKRAMCNMLRHGSNSVDKFYIQKNQAQHQKKTHFGQVVCFLI